MWTRLNSGLLKPSTFSLAIDKNGRIYAGTASGIFRSIAKSEIRLTDDGRNSLIIRFQNSPNPFTRTTTVSFTLPSASFVTLKVYDISGREVAVAASREFPADASEVQFDAKELPSGVYFYRLEANGQAQTKSFVKLSEP